MHDFTSACHKLAEAVLKAPAKDDQAKWLKKHVAQLLVDKAFVYGLSSKYRDESVLQTDYLRSLLTSYDEVS